MIQPNPNYETFRTYFEHFWLETQAPHNLFIFQCQNRTNNGMESLNRTLVRVFGFHPNLFAFISKSKEFSRLQEVEYFQQDNWVQIRWSLNKYEIFKIRQISAVECPNCVFVFRSPVACWSLAWRLLKTK